MNLHFGFDFLFGVFVGIALTLIGLIAVEQYDVWQERKKDNWK